MGADTSGPMFYYDLLVFFLFLFLFLYKIFEEKKAATKGLVWDP